MLDGGGADELAKILRSDGDSGPRWPANRPILRRFRAILGRRLVPEAFGTSPVCRFSMTGHGVQDSGMADSCKRRVPPLACRTRSFPKRHDTIP